MKTETAICQVCGHTFEYQRKYRPRIYCSGCRFTAYRAHSIGNYNPEYERWYRENVRKKSKVPSPLNPALDGAATIESRE